MHNNSKLATDSKFEYSGYLVFCANCPYCGIGLEITFLINRIETMPQCDTDLNRISCSSSKRKSALVAHSYSAYTVNSR